MPKLTHLQIARLDLWANRASLDLSVVVGDVVNHGSSQESKRLPVGHVCVTFPALRLEQPRRRTVGATFTIGAFGVAMVVLVLLVMRYRRQDTRG